VPDFVQVASMTAVESTPNSFYLSGNDIFFHTFDNRAPDAKVLVFTSTDSAINLDNKSSVNVFAENIDFYGGMFAVDLNPGNTGTVWVGKNCSYRYSLDNAFCVTSATALPILNYDSHCSHAGKDGFNYHGTTSTNGCEAIEINCTGFKNGRDADAANGANNGSTAHEGVKVLRLNCAYFENQNRNIHDIGNTKVWMIDCIAAETGFRGTSEGSANFAFGRSAGDLTEAWLDNPRSDGGADTDLITYNGATVHYRNPMGMEVKVGTGLFQRY
jgi:hypothetical protein